MNDRNRSVFLRIALVLAAVVVVFVIFQRPVRQMETGAAVWLLKALGAHNINQAKGVTIEVFPSHQDPFRALVAPSCSALASILTIACLGLLAPNTRGKRFTALSVACLSVAVGNIIRIAASVGIGLVFGRSSLILFHDVVGSIFGLAYTLAGYLIMLHILLPKRSTVPGFVNSAPASIAAAASGSPRFVAG
jgi:exosortase/archaeosortase family protein